MFTALMVSVSCGIQILERLGRVILNIRFQRVGDFFSSY